MDDNNKNGFEKVNNAPDEYIAEWRRKTMEKIMEERRLLYDDDTEEKIQRQCEYIKSRYNEYDRKWLTTKTSKLNRLYVLDTAFYPICSPSFLRVMGEQLTEPIEKSVGITGIHLIPNCFVAIEPFVDPFKTWGKMSCFQEVCDGVKYTYCPSVIMVRFMKRIEQFLFWMRFCSVKAPNEFVDTIQEYTSDELIFELCEHPKSFIPPEKWPEKYYNRYKYLYYPHNRIHVNFAEKLYNPSEEFAELRNYIMKIKLRVKMAEERKLMRSQGEIIKIPAEIPKIIYTWPDICYLVTMKEKVTEDTVEMLKIEIDDYFNSMRGEQPFFVAKKLDDYTCSLDVDFEGCSKRLLKNLIKRLEKSGMQIEKIVVEAQ